MVRAVIHPTNLPLVNSPEKETVHNHGEDGITLPYKANKFGR